MSEMNIDTNQFLTFVVDGDTYAFNIFQVQSVLDKIEITQVPNTPDYMVGVINLRGQVVPVINLRQKFKLADIEGTVDTAIIIVQITVDEIETIAGILVDSVKEVTQINDENIEPAPKLGTRLNTDFILGMGQVDEKFVTILDLNKIFSIEEIELIDNSEPVES